MATYYNEIDSYLAQWLRNLIAAGYIPAGDVDERTIYDVQADDLRGYEQCHFFAGIGGWPLGLRLAEWPDCKPVWTGSCPCQPFSAVGQKRGFKDERHLWPIWCELIRERRPATIFGEQSAQAVEWLRLVRSDLETMDYAMGAIPIEAACAGAQQLGDRFWFVATTDIAELRCKSSTRQQSKHEQNTRARPGYARRNYEWCCGSDGKKRRVDADIDLLAHGVSHRMGKLRAFGNAVTPPLAAAFIESVMDL